MLYYTITSPMTFDSSACSPLSYFCSKHHCLYITIKHEFESPRTFPRALNSSIQSAAAESPGNLHSRQLYALVQSPSQSERCTLHKKTQRRPRVASHYIVTVSISLRTHESEYEIDLRNRSLGPTSNKPTNGGLRGETAE